MATEERLVVRSPGVGVRRVAHMRRTAAALTIAYAVLAALGTAMGGVMALAFFVAAFCYAGLPLLAHARRVADPQTQTNAGAVLEGTLSIDGDEITVSAHDGVLTMSRASIADGWIEPTLVGGHRVVLRHETGDLGVVDVPSLAAGQELLSRVGFSADRHAMRVQTSGNAGQTGREMAVVASLFALAIPLFILGAANDPEATLFALGWLVANGLVAVALARAAAKPVVRVGLDGIAITRGRRQRFVAIRDVAAVQMTREGVAIALHGAQRPIVLRCWGVMQAALFARVQEVVRGFGGAAASAAALTRLDRQGRDLARWRDDLRRVASEDAGDYRRIGLSRDDLARLLAQGDAPPERRIGAALALASSGEPAERDRVRIAARASANEELRAALEAIAEDELDAAESAIGALLAAERPAARRPVP